MPFDIEFIRNTLEAEGIHIESDGPLDSFYNFAVAIREQTIKELQGGPHPFICLTEEDLKSGEEQMNEAPKKIWLDSDGSAWEHYSEDDTPYIRADIVDELVEVLEHTAQLLEALGGTALMAKDMLKKLE